MEKTKFEEIVNKLKYPKNKWLFLHEIESVILSSGRGVYPNWKNTKFLIKENNDILVRHGRVRPYGARLNGFIHMSGDLMTANFAVGDKGIILENSSFYGEFFRQPKVGDILRLSEGLKNIVGEANIKEVRYQLNAVSLVLWQPLKLTKNGRYSFYDNAIFSSDPDNCIHASISEGIYMRFVENEGKKKDKKLGVFHEEIRVKDIKEINLVVGSEYFNKTYKLE
jgi:hypothetical protein